MKKRLKRKKYPKVFAPFYTAVGERSLLIAVLERAILDVIALVGEPVSLEMRRQARKWCFYWEKEDSAAQFTFPWVCAHLDLDPKRVKRTIKEILKLPTDEQEEFCRMRLSHFSVAARYFDSQPTDTPRRLYYA